VNETYYRGHWTKIEPERFERHKQMFQWSDASRPLPPQFVVTAPR
jgi:hypothetical protein